MRALLVEPVRVDDRGRARQRRFADMVVDDDDFEPGIGRVGKRLMRIGPAIDGDHDAHPLLAQAQQGRGVGKGLKLTKHTGEAVKVSYALLKAQVDSY